MRSINYLLWHRLYSFRLIQVDTTIISIFLFLFYFYFLYRRKLVLLNVDLDLWKSYFSHESGVGKTQHRHRLPEKRGCQSIFTRGRDRWMYGEWVVSETLTREMCLLHTCTCSRLISSDLVVVYRWSFILDGWDRSSNVTVKVHYHFLIRCLDLFKRISTNFKALKSAIVLKGQTCVCFFLTMSGGKIYLSSFMCFYYSNSFEIESVKGGMTKRPVSTKNGKKN